MRSIWQYPSCLPDLAPGHQISLGEGQTPLLKSRFIGPALGMKNLYFKLENLNPTGSYKDRFAAAFVSGLASRGQQLCLATSSGNTGAALAAYCAAANIRCLLVVVDGAPAAKLTQMQLYGAEVCMVRGFGKDSAVTAGVFNTLQELAAQKNIPLPVSAYCFCPEGMQGVETLALEILDDLEGQADHLFSPAGGGGLTLAMARGVNHYAARRPGGQAPRVHCVQPAGNDTIAGPLRNGQSQARELAASTTRVSGLQVPGVLDGHEVIAACQALNGQGFVVEDDQVFYFQRKLAQKEGVFCEPAGAVALAGLAQALQKQEVQPDDTVVCLVTGTGFKDMLAVNSHFNLPRAACLDDYRLLSQLL